MHIPGVNLKFLTLVIAASLIQAKALSQVPSRKTEAQWVTPNCETIKIPASHSSITLVEACTSGQTLKGVDGVVYYFPGIFESADVIHGDPVVSSIASSSKFALISLEFVDDEHTGAFLMGTHQDLRNLFFDKIVAEVESKIKFSDDNLASRKRIVFGQSMGGFNALELALDRPSYFSKLELLCPALPTLSPYALNSEIKSYLTRTGAAEGSVEMLLTTLRLVLGGDKTKVPRELEKLWQAQNPLARMRKTSLSQFPPVRLVANLQDSFGFLEGARDFELAAQASKFAFKAQHLPGDHCANVISKDLISWLFSSKN